MADSRTSVQRAPVSPDILSTPGAFGLLAERLLQAARAELDRGMEGRPYTVVDVRLAVRPDLELFTRDQLLAELKMTAEIATG